MHDSGKTNDESLSNKINEQIINLLLKHFGFPLPLEYTFKNDWVGLGFNEDYYLMVLFGFFFRLSIWK